MRVVSCWCCFGCVQLSVVHRDPQQKQPSAGHAVGVDRLVHPAPSMDQNSVKMSSGDKVKHSSQSSGNLMVLPIRFSLPLVFISASCCDKQSFSVSVVQCNAHSFKVVSNHWFGNRKGIWPVKKFCTYTKGSCFTELRSDPVLGGTNDSVWKKCCGTVLYNGRNGRWLWLSK